MSFGGLFLFSAKRRAIFDSIAVRKNPWWVWLLPLPIVWWAALLVAGSWSAGMNLVDLLGKLSAAMNNPFAIHWTEYSARCLLYSVEFAEPDACCSLPWGMGSWR